MQVIGLCRFSYPALGGFQVEHDTIEDRIAFLYGADRMEERFRTFEAITLPSIRAQTDPNFTFLIVVGDAMPQAMLARLQGLVADIPQAVIQSRPPRRHRKVMQDAMNSVRTSGAQPCLQFRLDDDDAVGVSFVQDLRTVADKVKGLLDLERHIAIDFNQGFIISPDADGIMGQSVQRPLWTSALAVMFRPDVPLCVMNFSHAKLDKRMPTVSITGVDMMLRGYNAFNDSRQGDNVAQPKLTRFGPDEERHLKEAYGIDADHVRAVFST